jgi:5'-methylthioadenosine phosphorylase
MSCARGKEIASVPTHLSSVKETDCARVAIIGGTGLDEMPGFVSGDTLEVTTRFGSEQVIRCSLPRHGVRHSTPPHTINYRAQIAGLKKLGVESVVGVCSVGSLRPDLRPGSLAVLGDLIDFTKRRADTFFEAGEGVTHTDFSHTYCPEVSAALVEACRQSGLAFKVDAVYVGVEGPRYETPAEVRLFASWGGDVVGMTNVPEAILAREAGLCYGALAVVTNLATGLESGPLSHDDVREAVGESMERLFAVLTLAAPMAGGPRACSCRSQSPPPEFWD